MKWNRAEHVLQSVLSPTDRGLTYAVMRRAGNSTTTAYAYGDLAGKLQSTVGNRVYTNAAAIAIMPRPDGGVWFCIASGIQRWLDLYDPQGHLTKSGLRITGPEQPRRVLAATEDNVVYYGLRNVHFESTGNGRLTETSAMNIGDISLTEKTAIPILADNGDLILVNRSNGELLIFRPSAKTSKMVRLENSARIVAAAFHSDYLYLLSASEVPANAATVLKVDLQGNTVATYSCTPLENPSLLAVTADSLYLADPAGRGVRFRLP